MQEAKITKLQWWAIVLLGKSLIAIGLWQIGKINNNLEKLNNSVIDLSTNVQRINDKMLYMELRLDGHDRKLERWEVDFKNFFETYELKKRK